MTPTEMYTACRRGFMALYGPTEEALYLKRLTLREENENYLPIGGIEPERDSYRGTYYGLNVAVPFTGKIRLSKDFINELGINMGYQKASAYKTVFDITLEDGRVVEVKERSRDMEQKRGAFKEYYRTCKNPFQRIIDAYSLDMDLE
jgi:hypothetical protein